MAQNLTGDFLYETFKLCFIKKSFLELVVSQLKFQYIPKELIELKLILQSIVQQFSLNNKLPSYGIISQQHQHNVDVQNALHKIKESSVIDSDLAADQLFQFIRDVKFQLIFDTSVEKYNKGEKEEALKIFTEGANEISNFSFGKDSSQFLKVFADFHNQNKERQIAQENGDAIKEKVPFGIDPLDILTEGGCDNTDTVLWIMRSGVGKSTALKHTGMYCCRLGYKVLHIQLEGSKKEAYDKYTQIWTGSTYSDVKWGNLPREKMIKIEAVIDDMESRNRDIFVYSFEKFGSASMVDVREVVLEYQNMENCFPDIIIIDSLDLLVTGQNKKIDFDPEYKKDRLQGVAQLMKNMAVELNTRILTATQTGDISKQLWNNPDWTITRENTEGDRTLVKPFSFVFTGNQTIDEQKKNIIRVHVEKFRNYSVKDATYPIKSNYSTGKFYDKVKSMREFGNLYGDQ